MNRRSISRAAAPVPRLVMVMVSVLEPPPPPEVKGTKPKDSERGSTTRAGTPS